MSQSTRVTSSRTLADDTAAAPVVDWSALVVADGGAAAAPAARSESAGTAPATAASNGPQIVDSTVSATPPGFTAGNIVVYRIGASGSSTALTSAAAAVFLDEYTPTGTLVQSLALPTVASGANHILTGAGSSSSEGILNLSGDGRYLVLGGFDAAVGTASVATAAGARTFARVDASGTIDTTTTTATTATNDVRSVASATGSSFYIGTANTTLYETYGNTTTNASLAGLNTRDVELFGTQLYYSTASAVGRLGNAGPPTSGTQTTTAFTFSTAPGNGLGDFFLADLDGVAGYDTLYIVDSSNGLEKFSLIGTTWTLNGTGIKTAGVTAYTGYQGLAASVTGSTVSLFLSTPTRIFSITDTSGFNSTISASGLTLITDHSAAAFNNQAIRGVSFAPSAPATNGTLSINSLSYNEGDSGSTTYAFTVTRSGGSVGAVSATYTFAAGSTDATDFAGGTLPSSGTVNFANGQTTATITVLVAGDTTVESTEAFTLTLENPTGGATIGTAIGTGTIVNDDVAPSPGTLSIAAASGAEGNDGLTDNPITFTVTRTGGTLGAVSATYTITDGTTTAADFGGTLPTGTVSFADGQTSATFVVNITGDTAFEPNETFTATLSAPTGGATIGTASATGTITNDDSQPTISVDSVLHLEGNGGVDATAYTFTVSLANASYQTVTVNYATADGTAAAGSDYTAKSGTLTFAPGATSQTVTVLANGDTVFEGDEAFSLNLSAPTNATIASGQGSGTGTILNDDAAPANGSLSIDSVTHAEGNGGTTDYTFTVTRSGGSDGTVSATYTFANGTTDNADFTAPLGTGTVSFDPGETSKTITVTAVGDTLYEANETFSVTLGNATGGATLGTTTGTGTITNDDPIPTLTISDPIVVEGDAGTVLLTYTVTASAASNLPITFDIATADGTATAGSDYVAKSLTGQSIPVGQTSYTFTVTVNGDTVAERNETVLVNLTNASGATIADAQGVGTIRNDDGVPASAQIFSEDFTGFTAAGFSPTPTTGQLNSNIWRVVGLSDIANPAYGFTGPAGGDFGRGVIPANPATAGVYSPGSATGALILQPTGAELEAGGYVEARIQNTSGFTASGFQVTFDWQYRNNEARADNLQLAYSTDGTTFTVAPAASFSTPGTADTTPVFGNQHEDLTISNLFVGDQGYLYLRWIHVNSSGSGSRDEIGIDNVSIVGNLTATNVGSVSDISVSEGNSGTTTAVFTIIRSGDQGTASIDYATADGTAIAGRDYAEQHGTVTFADGETSKTVTILITGDTVNESNETVFLNLSNAVGLVLPDAQGKLTIVNDDTGPVGIYDIQGRGHTSPFVGQTVTTHGVVTAVDTNGFYIQDAIGDGDIATSDGLFVFTSATAPTVVVGNEIDVTGVIQEFVGSTAGSASVTELTSPTNIMVTNASVALPAAVLISTDGIGRAPPTQVIDDDNNTSYDPVTDGFDFYESLEGMRVTIQTPRVVANTDSFGETYVVASNGVGATGLNDRSGMTISAGDNNPETLTITRDAGINASYVASHVQGDVLGDVTGILHYQFAQYQLIVTDPSVTTTTHGVVTRESTTLVGDDTHLSYASFNVENLASVPDSTVDNRNTQAKVDAAFAAHANEVVNALKSPDIIGLQEVQDADGIGAGTDYTGTATANKLIAAIVAAGGPTYVYVEVAPTANNISGGEPNGNIRPGFLYNPARVSYVDGSATALTDAAYNGTRKPLVADFMFNGQKFTAIDMHSTSRGGSDPLYGANQPPTQAGDGSRTAQAAAVAGYIAAHPSQNFIVNGDFNGYYYEDALKTLESSSNVPGGTGVLNNLLTLLPVQERYTYYFGGYYQAFDNILVSNALNTDSRFDIVHYNAGFTDGLSATDHDQVVATIAIARDVATAVANADAITATETSAYRGNVLSNDSGGGASLAVTAVNGSGTVGGTVRLASGAYVVVNANGTFAYNTDGAFSLLDTGQTGTDSFTYTVSGGSTATVTVTVQGVTNSTPGSGNDVVAGTTGSDYYDLSGGGDDTVSGGTGDDGFFFGAAFTAADHVDGGSGTNDQVGLQGNYTGGNALVLGANTVTGVETLAVLAGFDYNITTVDANLSAGQTLTIYGSSLGAGDDLTFNGSAETDGMFRVFGGRGADNITTGGGNDGIYFGSGRFDVTTDHVDGGAGSNDQLALDGTYTGLTIARANVVNVETLVLLDGQAARADYSITLADDWTQGAEVHTVFAVGVRNGVAVDGHLETTSMLRFYGGAGNDTLIGGSAGNWFDGGAGADTMTGGAGVDTFSYTTAANSTGSTHDTIIDFDEAQDKIDLPGANPVTGIDAMRTGSLSASTFDSDLTTALATLTAHHAVQFTVDDGGALDGQIFEVIDINGVAGYQAGQDMVIQLVTPMGGPIVDPGVFI